MPLPLQPLLALCLALPFLAGASTPPNPNCTGLSAADLAGPDVEAAPFAREDGQKAPQRWEAAACPVELTSFSCYWHNYQRGWELEHRPLRGACRPFSGTAFLELIQGRTLLFVGDSAMRQFWQTVACLLPRRGAQHAVPWLRSDAPACAFGAKHCHLVNGTVTYPNATQLRYMNDFYLEGTTETFVEWGATNTSIVVVNSGLHFNQPKPYHNRLKRFVNHHLRFVTGHTNSPTVIWAETAPQHFVGTPNGYYDHGRKRKSEVGRCAAVNRLAAWKTDWRNRQAEKMMAQAGIPVLRLWDVLVDLWDFHLVRNGFSENLDCTHYCVPGPLTALAVRLLEMLEALRTPAPEIRTTEGTP